MLGIQEALRLVDLCVRHVSSAAVYIATGGVETQQGRP